jgi:RNA polymerase sigma factor (sigma-70 family)
MIASTELSERCHAMIVALNSTQCWELSQETLWRYVIGLLPHLSDTSSDQQLARAVTNYHLDHHLMNVLANHTYPEHTLGWQQWLNNIIKILSHNGLQQLSDPSIEFGDLVQVASIALARALPTYHYQSRFSTWAYSIIVRSVQRYLRDLQAAKRTNQRYSLAQSPNIDLPIDVAEHPENIIAARALGDQINKVLMRESDHRLSTIFRMHVIEDQHINTIGNELQLHPSRIRALLHHTKTLLQQNPDILAWLQTSDTSLP